MLDNAVKFFDRYKTDETLRARVQEAVNAYPGSLETPSAYAMVYLYEDLSGNVSILSIADFDIGSLCTY